MRYKDNANLMMNLLHSRLYSQWVVLSQELRVLPDPVCIQLRIYKTEIRNQPKILSFLF
jgi:hypothetical protein